MEAFHRLIRDFVGLLRYLLGVDRWRFCVLLVIAVAQGILGAVVIASTGMVVESASRVVRDGRSDTAFGSFVTAAVLVGATLSVIGILQPLRNAIAIGLGSSMTRRMRSDLLMAVMRPDGIGHLEDPSVADEIKRAGEFEWADLAPMTVIVQELGGAVTKVTTALGAGCILFQFRWWAPLLLAAGALSTHLSMASSDRGEFVQRSQNISLDREADYLRDLALDPGAAKEVRLFGLVGYLAERSRKTRVRFLEEIFRARRASLTKVLLSVTSVALANGIVIWHIIDAASDGRIGTHNVVANLQALVAMALLGHPIFTTWWLRQGAAALPHLEALPTAMKTGELTGDRHAFGRPVRELRFADVCFSYSSSGRQVLSGLDLQVSTGHSLAVVGANGSGKTTLLKMLTRMYDPTHGRITVDGRDLKTLDPKKWRRQIAVVFQDFIRFELTVERNIDPTSVGSAAEVRAAAKRAGALELIESLPQGFQTVLSRHYDGGLDLSGGQWQRVAIARALFAAGRGAKLLILDEPTANLDIKAEAELFDHFLELTRGLTTMLVTHRLASVRHVDRIVVLGEGRIIESGTHSDLMSHESTYARLFALQAQQFGID